MSQETRNHLTAWDHARTRSDVRFQSLNNVPVVGTLMRTLLRLAFLGKVWARQSDLYTALIEDLSRIEFQNKQLLAAVNPQPDNVQTTRSSQKGATHEPVETL